ncbi:hypothetical protein FEM48_Zijuj11G0107400 [Ziziphus jujuba var. spinosa]|uniref:Alpha 1,4-glycosyltransferase domain-containing protein n=1 Tax=Ziziphus jujuba var. spinosa TaxID=714518 RepID=A0A978UIH6_ZIZJJ|nr:hypothetical protein FEM48_Zijuj11G0107400 [Ziziphus jujuba var. spinosa]
MRTLDPFAMMKTIVNHLKKPKTNTDAHRAKPVQHELRSFKEQKCCSAILAIDESSRVSFQENPTICLEKLLKIDPIVCTPSKNGHSEMKVEEKEEDLAGSLSSGDSNSDGGVLNMVALKKKGKTHSHKERHSSAEYSAFVTEVCLCNGRTFTWKDGSLLLDVNFELSKLESGELAKEYPTNWAHARTKENSTGRLIGFRIAFKLMLSVWRKLPELEIFHLDTLTKKFHGRVLEFVNHGCTVQFYMVRLSPANSFGKKRTLGLRQPFQNKPGILLDDHIKHNGFKTRLHNPKTITGPRIESSCNRIRFVIPELKNTPAESWLEAITNADFIILKDLSELRNSVVAQSIDAVTKKWKWLNGAVMVFDVNHPILVDFIEEFASTFNGNERGHNGPFLVSRVIERVGSRGGYNLNTALPPKAFYTVEWNKIKKGFFGNRKMEVIGDGWRAC